MTTAIRVLEIANGLALSHGGPPRNAIDLHAALNRRGDVLSHLVSARSDGAPSPEDGPVAPPPPGAEHRVVRLLRLLATCDVVVIHGYYIWWSPAVAVLSRSIGKSVLVVPHGALTRHQRRYSRGRKRVWEAAAGPAVRASAEAFVVGSAIEQDELLEVFPRTEVVVSGIGTELPELGPDERPDRAPGAPVRLLSLSRIAPKKRIDLMIDAVAELAARDVPARLVVAGAGDDALEQSLRDRAQRLGVQGSVEFVGMLAGEDRQRAFTEADLFLAPSDDENFGISVAEALARGLPCVASAAVASASGLPEAAGAVLPAPTGPTIADAVQRLMQRDRGELRAAARRFAEEHYDWDVVAERWARLFAQVRPARAR